MIHHDASFDKWSFIYNRQNIEQIYAEKLQVISKTFSSLYLFTFNRSL